MTGTDWYNIGADIAYIIFALFAACIALYWLRRGDGGGGSDML